MDEYILAFSWGSLVGGLGSLFGGMKGFAGDMWSGFRGKPGGTPAMFGGQATPPPIGHEIGGKLRTGLGSLGSSLGSAVTGTLAAKLQRSMSPNPGDELRRNMDRAFPRTNPWERLGAGGGGLGGVLGTERMIRGNQAVKGREMKNQKEIALINARAHMGSSFGAQFPSSLNKIEGFIRGKGMARGQAALPGLARSSRMMAGGSLRNAVTNEQRLLKDFDQYDVDKQVQIAELAFKRNKAIMETISNVGDLKWFQTHWQAVAKIIGASVGVGIFTMSDKHFENAIKATKQGILLRGTKRSQDRRADELKDMRMQGFTVPKFKVGVKP